MNKRVIIFLMLITILLLCTCKKGARFIMFSNDEKKADYRMEQIFKAIKNKNGDTLKAMFSKQALGEAKDIDGCIDYLFNFLQGEVISWKRDKWSSGEVIDYGKKSIMLRSWYEVKTDKNIYKFFIIDYIKETINPNNQGLYTLRVIKFEDKDTQFTYWQDMKKPGIYCPFINE